MATHRDKVYKDENGLIISASQGRILERRKEAASLFREMSPKYASFQTLYYDIAVKLTNLGYPCNFNTVRNDLRQMGLIFNTPQTRKETCKAE